MLDTKMLFNTTYPLRLSVSALLVALIMPTVAVADNNAAGTNTTDNLMASNNKELNASCQSFVENPDHDQASLCVYYIKGFMAGAQKTNSVVAAKLKEKYSEPSSYMDRAIKHRVGNRLAQLEHKNFSLFCTPDKEFEARIVEKLSKDLPVATVELINSRILTALKTTCLPAASKQMSRK